MLGDGKSVVLSFDDGPAPVGALESILQTLRDNQIKAEFYVLGNEVELYPDAARKIVRDGHDIQNHSWSHADLAAAQAEDVRSELEETQNVIEDTTGFIPTKIRPPYGAGGFRGHLDADLVEAARELSLEIVTWDIDTEKIRNIESPVAQASRKTSFNILMLVQPGTARDLPSFIAQLKEWGFTIAVP